MNHIVVLCGGKSVEHEVSLLSVAAVLRNLNRRRHRVSTLGIRKDGTTFQPAELRERIDLAGVDGVEFPEVRHWLGFLMAQASGSVIAFPVLHGPFGEDGTVQGALEVLDIPYVGASVGGSAVGMNKIYCKAILKAAGLPVLPWVDFDIESWEQNREMVCCRAGQAIGFPLFVKPANLGSSVGVSKCSGPADVPVAIDLAFQFDDRVLVERGVEARELEVSVLGSFTPRASLPGEIVPSDAFYSYEAKYLDNASKLLIPAPLDPAKVAEIQALAVQAYSALQLEGMARLDFLMEKATGKIWINEPNTIPGFTRISMYPKLWEHSGLPFAELLDELIELAKARHRRRSRLLVDRPPRSERC